MNCERFTTRVIALTVYCSLAVCGCAESVTVPSSYSNYTSAKHTFQCSLPDGWERNGGGNAGPEWARCTKGSADIHITADFTGSALADLAEASNKLAGISGFESATEPVDELHDMGELSISESLSAYEELSEPAKLQCRLGPARQSEFTASAAFGGKLHGYRVTALGRDKRVIVVCKCDENDWSKIQPVFDKVISTLQRGKRR